MSHLPRAGPGSPFSRNRDDKAFTLPAAGGQRLSVDSGTTRSRVGPLRRAEAQVSSCALEAAGQCLSPSPLISLKMDQKMLQKTEPWLIVRPSSHGVAVSAALPTRLDLRCTGHWPARVCDSPLLCSPFRCSANQWHEEYRSFLMLMQIFLLVCILPFQCVSDPQNAFFPRLMSFLVPSLGLTLRSLTNFCGLLFHLCIYMWDPTGG